MDCKSGCGLNSFSKFQIGVTLSKNDDFAKENWFSSIFGKNVLSKIEGETFKCAIIHKTGAYIISVPNRLLEFSSSSKSWPTQVPREIKQALPEIDENFSIRIFPISADCCLLDSNMIQHPNIENMYFSENDTEKLAYLFIEGEAYGLSVNKKMIL